jgi:hypothetical protein
MHTTKNALLTAALAAGVIMGGHSAAAGDTTTTATTATPVLVSYVVLATNNDSGKGVNNDQGNDNTYRLAPLAGNRLAPLTDPKPLVTGPAPTAGFYGSGGVKWPCNASFRCW